MSENEFEKAPTLDGFREMVEKNQGVFLEEIGEGRTLVIRTENSVYYITIQDPFSGDVRVQGGKYFKDSEICKFQGSTMGGANIKTKWIGLGMHMEFTRKEGDNFATIETSPVQEISIIAPPAPEGTIH